MITFRDVSEALKKLNVERSQPVIAHASLSAFGEVRGGADTMLAALLANFDHVMMPVFTYKTMVTPEIGPPDNAITYGSGGSTNRMAEIYSPDMPADRLMGAIPEALRRHPKAQRSNHPILSFAGINVEAALGTQEIHQPLNPIRALKEQGGWVLLLGVDHTVNTSIHLAEAEAGRKQFVRWALTPQGVVACSGFPGCSDGFQALGPRLRQATRRVQLGASQVSAVPLQALTEAVRAMLAEDPLALLCARLDCERCQQTRNNHQGGH